MINPIDALHYANPKALDDLVGFTVETYYTKDNKFTCFWEKDGFGMIGKTKELATGKITKKCLEKIKEIQRDRSKTVKLNNMKCEDCKYFDIKILNKGEDIYLCQLSENTQDIYNLSPMQVTKDFLCKYFEINEESYYHNNIEE